jgi:hypothetical protein
MEEILELRKIWGYNHGQLELMRQRLLKLPEPDRPRLTKRLRPKPRRPT